jgi:hypothetical protein
MQLGPPIDSGGCEFYDLRLHAKADLLAKTALQIPTP